MPQGGPTKNHQNHQDKQKQPKPLKPSNPTKPDGIQKKMSRVILTQKTNLMEFKGKLQEAPSEKSQQIDWIKGTQKKMVGGTLRQPREN